MLIALMNARCFRRKQPPLHTLKGCWEDLGTSLMQLERRSPEKKPEVRRSEGLGSVAWLGCLGAAILCQVRCLLGS